MNDKIKVIHVGGSNYSGSTLLGLILGSGKKAFDAGKLLHLCPKTNCTDSDNDKN